MRKKKPHDDSDTDSELSVLERGSLDLASSHSSDEDEDDFENEPRWDQPMPKNKVLGKLNSNTIVTIIPFSLCDMHFFYSGMIKI